MKKIIRVLPYVLLVFVLAFTPLVAVNKTRADDDFPVKTQQYKRILTVWNIDTFEGGAGSRADFLSKRAAEYCGDGLLIMVKSHTTESAKTAIEKGEVPSLISYGAGAGFVAPVVKKLKSRQFKFSDEYFVPWCGGGYFLIKKQGGNRPIEKLCVSDGENNLAAGALYFSDVEYSELISKTPENACYELISDRADALLGTQRDIRRLEVRNVAFTATPLETFSDLFQYISVTTSDAGAYEAAVGFIEYLLDTKTQAKTEKLYMMPAIGEVSAESPLAVYDRQKTLKTLSPFTPKETLENFKTELYECVKTQKKCRSFENALKEPSKCL